MRKFNSKEIDNLEKIGAGIFSNAYMYNNDEDGKKYIVKKAINEETKHSWLILQKRAKIAGDFAYKINKNPNVLIPRILCINEEIGYSIEECAIGKELTKDMMENMSKVKKYDIAKNIALFLNDLHQSKSSFWKKYPKGIKPFLMGNKKIMKDIKKIGVWKSFKEFLKKADSFLKDDVIVPIHGDIAPRNIFYDIETQKVSFIDFGVARMSSVYVEFISIGSNLSDLAFPKNFVYDIVDFYNELPKPNRKIFIDKDLLIPLISSTAVLRTYPYHKFQQPFVVGAKIIEAIGDWNNLSLKQFISIIKLKKEYKPPINLDKVLESIQAIFKIDKK